MTIVSSEFATHVMYSSFRKGLTSSRVEMKLMDRSMFTSADSVAHIWTILGLPHDALRSLDLLQDVKCYPSSFKVDQLAQTSIALSALAAALVHSTQRQCSIPRVTVSIEHACVEFKSERLYELDGRPAASSWGVMGGLYRTADGYVRLHDSFPNHRYNALKILGLEINASREEVAESMLKRRSIELEVKAFESGAVIAALRSLDEWDILPQAAAAPDFPIFMERLTKTAPYVLPASGASPDRCLSGIRVIEMSRVVAAPVAGKTLAAHGADVIWITSPTLPALPDLDVDLARGKRTVQLDIKKPKDKETLLELLRNADVFLQSYRPGSLAARGLSTEDLIRINPNLIVASLNAYGPDGPWSQNRGFDSLVQTCSGLNVTDAQCFDGQEPVRVLPCQALDHGSGYFLATAIMSALYKRAVEGGAYEVKVSLVGTMKYLRSLGRYQGREMTDRKDFKSTGEVIEYLEIRPSELGQLNAVRHSAKIDGIRVGWDIMPKPLGSDKPVWL